MTDKDVRRNPLSSSVSGIPRRPVVSRLQTPTIRTQRSTPSLASTSSLVSQTDPLATSPSSRIQPIAVPNKFISSPRSTAIASKASSTLRSQKSNGSLKPSTSKPNSPIRPVSRTSRPTATTPRAARPASHSPRNQARNATAPPTNKYEGDQGDDSHLKAPLSIKEQIVARRAAMKKGSVSGASSSSTLTGLDSGCSAYSGSATRSGSVFSDFGPDDVPSAHDADEAPDDLFGRPTIRQAVIKALSTGSLNIMSRQLASLPATLFAVHLGVTPVPNGSSPTKNSDGDIPSTISRWEAVDLAVLKAGDNEITELQGEFCLFGGLKSLDLHKNNLATLPQAFADLGCLAHLDLSHCLFTSLPSVLSALPALIQLNMSHNALTSLSFGSPPDQPFPLSASPRRDEFLYPPANPRVAVPFPALQILFASNNKISAQAIRPLDKFPRTLMKIDLNYNPLCDTTPPSLDNGATGIETLLETLSQLESLKEVLLRSSGLSDAALTRLTLDGAPFPMLEALDVGDNDDLSEACVRRALLAASKQGGDGGAVVVGSHMDVLVAASAAAGGSRGAGMSPRAVKLVIGRHIVKEAWEIELERRAAPRKGTAFQPGGNGAVTPDAVGQLYSNGNDDASFAIGRDQKTDVGRNGVVTNRASSHSPDDDIMTRSGDADERGDKHKSCTDPFPPVSCSQSAVGSKSHDGSESPREGNDRPKFQLGRYYDDKTRSLTLPSAVLQTARRGGAAVLHARSRSLNSAGGRSAPNTDMLVPLQTFPHAHIVTHLWARTTLRTLVLSNRRADASFLLSKADNVSFFGTSNDTFITLPVVEELRLDGCNLQSRVKVSTVTPSISSSSSESSPARPSPGGRPRVTHEVGHASPTPGSVDVGTGINFSGESFEEMAILPTLRLVFPALTTLDLSYNALTTLDGVGDMFLPPSSETLPEAYYASLQTLRVRGNKIDKAGLEDLVRIGEMIKLDTCVVSRWRGVEVDLRENEIGQLPGLLGWLPLEIMLVESNGFRAPNRRVWERDGTNGLLSYLRMTV